MKNEFIFINADSLIEFEEMLDEADHSPINDATATWVLKTEVDSEPGLTLASGTATYVAASNGKYQGVLDKSAPSTALVKDAYYWVEMTVVAGTRNDFRRKRYKAVYRGFN